MSESARNIFPHLLAAVRSDIGRKRKNNEDASGAFPAFGVWCVADGMGGGDDGEVASAAVVKSVDAFLSNLPVPTAGAYSAAELAQGLGRALSDASGWIFQRAKRNNLKGCGSTFVGVVFDSTDPGTALALHVGDSRLYRLRGRDLKQITKDHSVAEMMGTKDEKDLNPMFRGMILRAVGIENTVDVEQTPFTVREGDVILICSDGLTRMVSDRDITDIIRDSDGDVKSAVDRLIAAANKAGGVDNVTVALVQVGNLPPSIPAIPISSESEGSSRDADVGSNLSGSTQTTQTGDEDRSAGRFSRRFWVLSVAGAVVLLAMVAGIAFSFGRRGENRVEPVPLSKPAPVATPERVQAESPAVPGPEPVKARVQREPTSCETNHQESVRELLDRAVRQSIKVEVETKDEAELRKAAEQLKAERESREREERKDAEVDKERRDVAMALADMYTREEFAVFAIFANKLLGRDTSSALQNLGRKLNLCKNDVDASVIAGDFTSEVISLAIRIGPAIEKRNQALRERFKPVVAACQGLVGADPSEIQVQRRCEELMRIVLQQMKKSNGRYR